MKTVSKTYEELLAENERLRQRLEEAEPTFEAIRGGEVDAVVVHGPAGEQVYTFEGADRPYRLLVEAMQQGVATLSRDGTVLYCNACFADLLQTPQERVIGAAGQSFVSDGDKPLWADILNRAGTGPLQCEFQLRRDDHFFPAALQVSPLPFRGALCLLVTDLTQQKQYEAWKHAENLLRASEVRYRRLFESAKDGVLILDTDTARITDANPFICELLGYSHADLMGKELWQIGLFEDKAANQAAVRELQDKQYVRFDDLRLRTRTGRPLDVEFMGNVYSEGNVSLIQCNIRDITERKHLQDNQRRLVALVESSEDAIVSKTLDGIIQTWNAAAHRLFGYSADQAVGRHISLIIPPDRAAEEDRIIASLRAGERVEHFDTVRVRRDGQLVEVSLTISPIRDETGQVIGASKIARDVSERKRLEQELRKYATDLSEADRRKDEFLAMLAHELRNPLAPIRNALHIIQMRGRERRQATRQAWGVIERQVESLVRLVDDLLDVSRISRGKINLQKQAVDVATILGRAVESSRPLIETRRHELQMTLPDEPMPVNADVTRMAQVVLNLLNNAAKYTSEGGRIWLTAEKTSSEVAIRVQDTGMGIPAEILPRMFDMFAQAERTLARSEGGLGIGLTLVRRLTEMHGGTVEASSPGLGQGSEFVVRLPLLTAIPSSVAPGNEGGQQRVQARAQRRILVVDDNRDSADSLAMLLRLVGHDVRTVHDGRQALVVAAAYRPDLVLLDIGLPGLDGYEVARRLRQEPWIGQTVLVALTGYGGEDDRQQAQAAGFTHHMVKPVDFDSLQQLLLALEPPTN
jgi:PAS domain S-box-containing protein